MAKVITKDIDFGYKKINKNIKKIRKKPYVKVGFIEGKKGNKLHKNSNGLNVAEVAALNEFGSMTNIYSTEYGTVIGIPSRPFMRSTFDENFNKWHKAYNDFALYFLLGDVSLNKQLLMIGEMLKKDIKHKIMNHNFASNSPITIKAKGSSHPLIDTKQMLNSVQYKSYPGGNKE